MLDGIENDLAYQAPPDDDDDDDGLANGGHDYA